MEVRPPSSQHQMNIQLGKVKITSDKNCQQVVLYDLLRNGGQQHQNYEEQPKLTGQVSELTQLLVFHYNSLL